MTLSDLASIGSFVSGVAVLISLIYFSLQMRQNTKHSRALIQQGRAARSVEILFGRAELEDSAGMEACNAGSPDITARDLYRFRMITRASFLSLEDSCLQYKAGLLDEKSLKSFEGPARAFLSVRGNRAMWRLQRASFGREFCQYMDRILAETRPTSAADQIARWKSALTEESAA